MNLLQQCFDGGPHPLRGSWPNLFSAYLVDWLLFFLNSEDNIQRRCLIVVSNFLSPLQYFEAETCLLKLTSATGAGLTGAKMARRIGNIEEFEFISIGENHNQGRLAVGIFISGLVFEQEDFRKPWEGREDKLEKYVLQWESENLIAISTAIQDWITSKITIELMKQGAMVTVLSSLLTALSWPTTILAATDFIDSKWSIAIDTFPNWLILEDILDF
ncbi:uncharacterized protein [Aristolochia californica]|uniref:uncharacterized protein n=1 Tax=Aristolochia californica TaxID=171875 RepID=UPI0035E2B0B9